MTTNPNCVEKKNTAYLTVKETEYSVDRPLQNQKNQPWMWRDRTLEYSYFQQLTENTLMPSEMCFFSEHGS